MAICARVGVLERMSWAVSVIELWAVTDDRRLVYVGFTPRSRLPFVSSSDYRSV